MLAAETAAPSWLPLVVLAVPVTIMLAVLVPALRRRGRAKAARRSQARRRQPQATELGSAREVVDPSGYSTDALLKALAVRPEDHGPTPDGQPHDEGWAGTMLGLRSKMSASTTVLEPHVFWGTRAGRQVFVRIGPDEKIEGGTTMLSNRHVRDITVLRVAAPEFELASDDGLLRAADGTPPEVVRVIAPLAADRATWGDVRVTGGPEGIVAARSAVASVAEEWVYDLWLCERIATVLELPALAAKRIGPAWKVPYGLGKSLTADRR